MAVALKNVPKLSKLQRKILGDMLNVGGWISQDEDGSAYFLARFGWSYRVRTDTLRFLYDWGLVNAERVKLGMTRFTVSRLAHRVMAREAGR